MLRVGRDLEDNVVPTPAGTLFTMLLGPPPNGNISRERVSTAFLGNPFQSVITLTVKNFLTPDLNLDFSSKGFSRMKGGEENSKTTKVTLKKKGVSLPSLKF